ncbi:uncharacterized protein LTR77_010774 [Saxophila tyrrhenica]|uniref:GAF domain-containing protein n=1 Tax=Saxophila tyrrhenica TaxID=1690608 RepID=A0AAV9NUT9_9PEZI|nr:hypothetical protein LTR77_010774 [Saxophila tyrrhenica]
MTLDQQDQNATGDHDHALKPQTSWVAGLPGRHVVGPYVQSNALERLRVWEVRKYCQIKPALSSQGDDFISHSDDLESGDYALTAILRCVLLELGADLAFISLLDDSTQYFIAGATRSAEPTTARSSVESTQWYGCDAVLHAGGLCNRTIRLAGDSALYEEFDMRTQDYTKSLPFVNGDIARLRYYAGVPLTTPEGHAIGTLFVMANEPAETSLSAHQQKFLCDSAVQVMRQLKQAVQALEGERIANFNAAISSLARGPQTPNSENSTSSSRSKERSVTAAEGALQLQNFYDHSAKLLLDGFDFGSVFLQEVPLHQGNNQT